MCLLFSLFPNNPLNCSLLCCNASSAPEFPCAKKNQSYILFFTFRELKMEESSMNRTSCRELLNRRPVRIYCAFLSRLEAHNYQN